VTFGHRRGSRVIRKALDLDIVLVNAHDPFHHSNRNPGFVEIATLLDVQLDVAVKGPRRDSRVGKPVRIAADLPQPIRQRDPVVLPLQVQGLAEGGTAADEPTFLVLPDHHLQRMPRHHPTFLQSADHFNRRQRSQVAVEIPAARN
jgi:hypothetical protein